jgi:hypothetical protein
MVFFEFLQQVDQQQQVNYGQQVDEQQWYL